jgi:hypothetical protein
MLLSGFMCVCVCVCVCKRERERKYECVRESLYVCVYKISLSDSLGNSRLQRMLVFLPFPYGNTHSTVFYAWHDLALKTGIEKYLRKGNKSSRKLISFWNSLQCLCTFLAKPMPWVNVSFQLIAGWQDFISQCLILKPTFTDERRPRTTSFSKSVLLLTFKSLNQTLEMLRFITLKLPWGGTQSHMSRPNGFCPLKEA